MKAPQGEFHQQGQETHILRKKNCQSRWTPFRGYCYKTFPSQRLSWYDAEKEKIIWTDESSWDFDSFSQGEPNHLNTTESCIEDDRRECKLF
uniref:Uncharacterized protein n=1 Tax=Eptatretus burgeri TaxID=7764 RepID=A0A8C4QDV7_EPTBU